MNDLMGQTPTLITVLQGLSEQICAQINCMRIGLIDEVLDNNQVKCSITNKMLIQTNDDGSSQWLNYPPIIAKVWYLGGSGGSLIQPLSQGDPCLLLFNDREIYSFFATKQISPLNSTRMHSLSDCICIPMYQPQVQPSMMQLKSDKISLEGNVIINGKPYRDHTHSYTDDGTTMSTGGVEG